ncbi:MAG: bifunctional 2-polyprenyl-6-hydroxyphenol methylase/3-demethylubiquinol 3-O-methyltransferase UbiG, partial [Pseudomonadota bacterium]
CGAGYLSNELAKRGCSVTGVDLSEEALDVAKRLDSLGSVMYRQADIVSLDLNQQFDAVTAMDILEHIENPKDLVRTVSRHLKPGGRFLFYTFNRNLISYLLAIKAVEWFVANVPENLHLYSLFIKPNEMKSFLEECGFESIQFYGVKPKLPFSHLKQIALTGTVPAEFEFEFCASQMVSYMGSAVKKG